MDEKMTQVWAPKKSTEWKNFQMIAPSSPVWVAHKPGAATAGKWSMSDSARSQSKVETR